MHTHTHTHTHTQVHTHTHTYTHTHSHTHTHTLTQSAWTIVSIQKLWGNPSQEQFPGNHPGRKTIRKREKMYSQYTFVQRHGGYSIVLPTQALHHPRFLGTVQTPSENGHLNTAGVNWPRGRKLRPLWLHQSLHFLFCGFGISLQLGWHTAQLKRCCCCYCYREPFFSEEAGLYLYSSPVHTLATPTIQQECWLNMAPFTFRKREG